MYKHPPESGIAKRIASMHKSFSKYTDKELARNVNHIKCGRPMEKEFLRKMLNL